jgi:hypothetical protein
MSDPSLTSAQAARPDVSPNLAEQMERGWHDAVVAVAVLLCPALIGLVFFAVPETREGVGMATLTAAAAFGTGAFFGFIFGIPRMLASPQEEGTPSSGNGRNRVAPNTNLEQISDWLTKILVGVSLVELKQIAGGVGHLAEGLAPGLGGGDLGYPVAVTLMISFTVIGFVGSYLFTRLRLEGAFSLTGLMAELEAKAAQVEKKAAQVEQVNEQVNEQVKEVKSNLREKVTASARAQQVVESQLRGSQEGPTQDELVDALRGAPQADRVNAFYAAREVRRANWRDGDKALVARAIPVFEALIECDEKNVFHRNHGELAYALKDQKAPALDVALEEIEKAIAIRGSKETVRYWPYEFTRAWCKIKLDPGFRRETASSESLVTAVCRDLEVPMRTGSGFKAVRDDRDVSRWIELNLGDPRVADLKARLRAELSR